MSDNPAIELSGVRRRRGEFTLGPLTFSVPRGVVVGLIGNNGAGKTTTLDIIMGLGRPDAGAVHVLGMPHPRDAAPIKAKTAYVTPDLDFSPWKTIGRSLDFLSGFYDDWDWRRCDRLLAEFGLARNAALSNLSLGEKMRFLLSTALSRRPELLLLDEPTVHLDPAARQMLSNEIGILREREAFTAVISSHQIEFIERLIDYVAILHRGRLIEIGPVDQLLDRYRQVDILVTPDNAPRIKGCKLINYSGDRARFLCDTAICPKQKLCLLGLEILAITRMSLEELFLALTTEV